MKEWLALKTIPKEYVDLSERKLREFLGHPTHPLPARLVGGKWLVARSDLDAWPGAGELGGRESSRRTRDATPIPTKGKVPLYSGYMTATKPPKNFSGQ